MKTFGFSRPLYILPFDHRASFAPKMFGWHGDLTPAQTAEIAAAKRVIYVQKSLRENHENLKVEGVRISRAFLNTPASTSEPNPAKLHMNSPAFPPVAARTPAAPVASFSSQPGEMVWRRSLNLTQLKLETGKCGL